MNLLTPEQEARLLDNGRLQAAVKGRGEIDFYPVAKLFNSGGAGIWLLTEIDPEAPDVAKALCDLGMGYIEMHDVRLSELESFEGHLGLGIENAFRFRAKRPISHYAEEALMKGRIVA